jgi:SAM-dependent methyltransferase
MIDIPSIANNLEYRSDGVWYARHNTEFAYPEEGNAFCYGVEESSFWFNHRNAFIIEALQRYPPDGVLFDIGGGNGFVAKAIGEAGFETILVEPGVQGIRNAQRRGLSPLICATLEDADFSDHCLAAVGLFDVLEHTPDDVKFLSQLHKLLVPGGRLYLTVPAYQFLWSVEDVMAHHYRRYTRRHLDERLQKSGFQVDFFTYIFATLPFPIFLFRTLPSLLGWRKPVDFSRTATELNPESSLANRLIDAVLRMELMALRRLKRLPFGGSCLLVARTLD